MRLLILFLLLLVPSFLAGQGSPASDQSAILPLCGPQPASKPCATKPRPIQTPDPKYSKEAIAARLQGTVVLSLVVGTDGATHDLQVIKPLGKGLDEQAIATVSKWKFEPGIYDGKPVPVRIKVEVGFYLQNRR